MSDLFRENHFDKDKLIALRKIFSNAGLMKLISSGLNEDEIINLSDEQLKDFKFRDINKYSHELDLFDENLIFAGEVIDWCDDENIKIISYFDDSYPESLKTLEVPPAVIFCYGDESLLQKSNNVAIVGTRDSSALGEQITKKTSSLFAKHGINIVSGLANGIDEIAHRTALLENGLTTAVLVDIKNISPTSNVELAKEICNKGGLILSENIPGLPKGEKYLYLERNRLQAALSSMVFIIESDEKSGTATTAKEALKQGKKIYVPDLRQITSNKIGSFKDGLHKKLMKIPSVSFFSSNDYPNIIDNLKSV